MTKRTWRFPRLPMEDWTFVTLCAWVAIVIGSVAITIGMANFARVADLVGRTADDIDVTYSVWSVIVGVSVWYGAFVAGYFMHEILPKLVTYGRTRRDSAIEATLFCGILAVLLAVLVTIGFQLERALYAIGDWSQGTPESPFYSSYSNVFGLLVDQLLTLGVWVAAGAMIGAAFYRGSERGIGAVVLAVIIVGATGNADSTTWKPLSILADHVPWNSGAPTILVAALVGIAVAVVITWGNVKDMPIRTK